MDLTPGPYALLLFTASDLASFTSHIHNWVLLLLWLHPFILSGVIYPLISSSIEIEEKNRMGKTRDLFKKIRDTKGQFHAKMGSIKDRNCVDLTEAEDIKKRWQGYTEELFKKRSPRPG